MESDSSFFPPFIGEPPKSDRRGIGFYGLQRWFQPSSPNCSMSLRICSAVVAHSGLLGRLGAALGGSSCCWRAWLLLQVAACLGSALSQDSVLPSGPYHRILFPFPIFSPETASFRTPQILAEACFKLSKRKFQFSYIWNMIVVQSKACLFRQRRLYWFEFAWMFYVASKMFDSVIIKSQPCTKMLFLSFISLRAC